VGHTFVLTGPQQFVHQGALIRAIRDDGTTVELYDDHKAVTGPTVVATVRPDHPAVAALVAALREAVNA
jgi:hypothetical protein